MKKISTQEQFRQLIKNSSPKCKKSCTALFRKLKRYGYPGLDNWAMGILFQIVFMSGWKRK